MLTVSNKFYLKYSGIKKQTGLLLCFLALAVAGYAQNSVDATKKATNKDTIPKVASVDTGKKIAVADTLQKNKISIKDANEISFEAEATIQSLQNLLNYVTFNDNSPSELADIITNSYKPSRNRVFYNKDVIIEDDIDPKSTLHKTKDAPVEKYLNDLDLQYIKTPDATIAFSNFFISDVKKKDYVYVKVRFNTKFNSKYKTDSTTVYPVRQREALMRMEKSGTKKWDALIMSVIFYDPAIPTEDKDNDMQVTTDTSSNAAVVSAEDFNKEKQAFILARQEEEKKQQAIFDEYVTSGNNYITNKQYKAALEMYEKAKDLKTLVPSLDKHIIDAKKLIAENTYENYKSKGDKANSERKFTDAIQFYNYAISLRPEASSLLQPDLARLSKMVAIIALPSNKLQSGDFQGTIDECEKVLHEHKKDKNEYPELYFLEGTAYQKIAESKLGDTRDLDRAFENYNLAIQYFINYKEARIARAEFFVNHKADMNSAITDYDVLATNELDDSPDKPLYYVAKAKLKDKLQIKDGALADYNKAISLSPANALLYYDKGELQYRLKDYPNAEISFSTAIKLNPKYAAAYYYRGLNFVDINNSYKAGLDFANAEKFGIEPYRLGAIDSISNVFFLKGKDLSDKHDFANADSAYNNALKIRKCNANALNGKAEMRLITGDEQTAKKNPAAIASYNESIALNRQAIICNPVFSDAHFKEGLAHFKIKEYDLAIASYTNAIKSDIGNVQAYIERGNTYQVQAKYAKAVEDYNQVIIVLQANLDIAKKGNDKTLIKSVTDDISRSNQLNGQAQYYLADYITAILSLNKAIDLQQTNNEAFYYRGLVYFSQGELSKSNRDLDEAIKILPHYKYYYANGQTNFKNKNYQVAIAHFSAAITGDSLNVLKNKYYLRGLSYYKSKQYAEAVGDFDVYNKSESAKTDTSFYADYGVAQLFAGQDTAAFKSFNIAINKSPNNARALYGLGCAYAKGGQFDKAFDSMQKAFATHALTKDEIKLEEEAFLSDFNKVKANRSKYNDLKKTSLASN